MRVLVCVLHIVYIFILYSLVTLLIVFIVRDLFNSMKFSSCTTRSVWLQSTEICSLLRLLLCQPVFFLSLFLLLLLSFPSHFQSVSFASFTLISQLFNAMAKYVPNLFREMLFNSTEITAIILFICYNVNVREFRTAVSMIQCSAHIVATHLIKWFVVYCVCACVSFLLQINEWMCLKKNEKETACKLILSLIASFSIIFLHMYTPFLSPPFFHLSFWHFIISIFALCLCFFFLSPQNSISILILIFSWHGLYRSTYYYVDQWVALGPKINYAKLRPAKQTSFWTSKRVAEIVSVVNLLLLLCFFQIHFLSGQCARFVVLCVNHSLTYAIDD